MSKKKRHKTATLLECLFYLTFTSVRFNDFDDFLHLIQELKMMRVLSLKNYIFWYRAGNYFFMYGVNKKIAKRNLKKRTTVFKHFKYELDGTSRTYYIAGNLDLFLQHLKDSIKIKRKIKLDNKKRQSQYKRQGWIENFGETVKYCLIVGLLAIAVILSVVMIAIFLSF